MLYQLPNGRTINISVEDFLRMDDALEQELIASNTGDVISSSWFGSVIKPHSQKNSETEENNEDSSDPTDYSLDFDVENEDTFFSPDVDINNIPDEDGIDGF